MVARSAGTLFARALERYATRTMRERIARLEHQYEDGHPYPCSECDGVARVGSAPLRPSARELEGFPHNAELRARIAAYLEEIGGSFRRNIGAAQRAGTVPLAVNDADTARLLLGGVLGIQVLARANPDRALLEGVAKPALALLNGPRPRSRRALS